MIFAPDIKVFERFSILCPLGVRFWDIISNAPASDGLVVAAYPPARPELRREAAANHSNVFLFHDLPGLRAVQNSSGDAAFWMNPPVTKEFLVKVRDSRQRFLPMNFRATAPSREAFRPACLQPWFANDFAGVPLFSSVTRSLPATVAIVRTELQDFYTRQPAPWAVVEATVALSNGTVTALGMSDEQGRVVIAFGYPQLPDAPLTNPSPPNGNRSLSDRSWQISLRAFYETRPPGDPQPDLCDLLNQDEANLLKSISPDASVGEITLQFGRELILRRDPPTNDSVPALFIKPAAPPP